MNAVLMAAFVAASIIALYFYMELKSAGRENIALRRALTSYEEDAENEINDSDEVTAEQSRRSERMLGKILNNTEFLMSAIEDLKTAIGGLIIEGTSDIAALVAKINAQSNQDPAIVALTTQVTDATTAMHQAFTGATGVALQPATLPPAPEAAPVADAPAADPAPSA